MKTKFISVSYKSYNAFSAKITIWIFLTNGINSIVSLEKSVLNIYIILRRDRIYFVSLLNLKITPTDILTNSILILIELRRFQLLIIYSN
jgi:hypothetical protein